jgi:uncharacterized protein YkwD
VRFTGMKITFVMALIMFWAAAVCAQGPSNKSTICQGKGAMAPDAVAEILNAHNKVREQFNLGKLTWNCKLAEFAQEWASRGIFEHRTDSLYGENIFATKVTGLSPAIAVQRWLAEQSFWDNKTGACEAGKVCSHYTQVVWKKTTQIGCGVNPGAAGTWKTLVVCNYDPASSSIGPAY